MPQQGNQMIHKSVDLVWLGAVFGLFYWLFQAFRDTYMLDRGAFLQNLLSPDIMSFAMRLLVVTIILLFCIHVKYLQERIHYEKVNRKASSGIFALILSAVGFILLYWILDSFQDIIIQSKGSLFERIVTPGTTVLITRFLSVFTVITLIFITQYLIYSRRKANKAIQEAQDRLIRTKENLHKIVYHIKDGLLVLGEDSTVMFMNPASEKLFGQSMSEMLGKKLNYKIGPEEIKEMDIITAQNNTLITDTRSTPILWENENAILVSLRDITEIKQVEKIRHNFLSLISVNLKTPITGIMGSIQNMQEGLVGQLTATQKEYLHVMYQSIRSKFNMINEMLTVISLESRGVKVQMESVELSICLNAIKKKYCDFLHQKQIDFVIKGMEKEILIHADAQKFNQTLEHIMQNAVTYIDSGSIIVDVIPSSKTVDIYITDTGRGMDDATLKTLFSREKLIHEFPSAKKGLGFGLYIVKNFMQLQNGDITAVSTIGKGSQFKLTIPLYHEK